MAGSEQGRQGKGRPRKDRLGEDRSGETDGGDARSDEPPRDPRQPADFSPHALARRLLREARSGALATLEGGAPLATLVALATDHDGAPILLVSALSAHTRNLAADRRCSLMIASGGKGDPLAHPRVSLTGEAHAVAGDMPERARLRARYLARHPKAALYVDFADFSFFRFEASGLHVNGGFARAHTGPAAPILTALDGAEALIALEAEAIAHMNEDHADALELYATVLCGRRPGRWRATGVDPDGLDLMAGDEAARIPFPERVEDGRALRLTLKRLADAARAGG